MEFQVELYKNLITNLSNMGKKKDYYNKDDFEQELWLKLYSFIKLNSGEAKNFPLIKSVLRNHLLGLIRIQKKLLRYKSISIESLILRGIELVYPGFGPDEEAEFREIGGFINEWLQQQDVTIKKFIVDSMLNSDGENVLFHRVKVCRNISREKRYKIISSLKNFLMGKGVIYVYSKRKK